MVIEYQVADFQDYKLENDLNVISFIYAHFPPKERKDYFVRLSNKLKNDGRVIFEGFGRKHLEYQKINPTVGGPKEEIMLFSEEEVREAFRDL